MKKIAIIGGSGFIGERLCDRLHKRKDIEFTICDITASKKYPEKYKYADVRKKDTLLKTLRGIDLVINLAAEHKDNISPIKKYYDTNVNGQINLCESMDELGIKKLIFTSSVAVYGFTTSDTDEGGKINPFHAYGDSKYKAEETCENWCDHTKQLFIIRPTVVFGEGNRGNVYNLLKQIAVGKFIMVGKGENQKSMAYVENIAAFIEYLIDKNSNKEIFNYIDKPDLNMNKLVEVVSNSLNKKIKRVRLPYKIGLLIGYICDFISLISSKNLPISSLRIRKFCSKTQFKTKTDLLGFEKPVSLEDGLKRTVHHEFTR